MRYFILFGHPEPHKSFNAAMRDHAVERLREAGHEVVVSDLYAMGFNPVASGADFAVRRFPERLQYDREQKFACAQRALAPDVVAEIDKLLWCDIFVMQFPLYWFSMPAIVKGWIDRVFVNSLIYGVGKRYETGGLAGRRAMVATTTGAYASMFESDGLLGDHERALWHIHNGILFYAGFEVLAPFIGYSPAHSDTTATDAMIDDYTRRLLDAPSAPAMRFHPTSDFDANFRLKADVEPVSAGHWRRPG